MGIVERKEREKAERRRSILDTARDLIKEKSYEEITMEEIARRLELSRATLYLYFRNKSEIFLTLLTEGMYELRDGYAAALKDLPEDADDMSRLMQMAFAFFEFYSRSHSYFDLLVTKRGELTRESSDEVVQAFEESGQTVIKPIAEVYGAGVQSGAFPKYEPAKMAYILRAVTIGIAVGFREGNLKFPEDVEILRNIILYGIQGPRD